MPKPRTTPRKRPRQARSTVTVDAILQAAAYILEKHGWEGFTTNRVAERAGVNIASLYQYFPNKESIVVELQRRHIAKARQGIPDSLRALQAKGDLRALLTVLARAGVEEHQAAPALHRVFAEELPRSARHADPEHDAHVHATLKELIRPLVRNVPDLDLATFVLRAAGHAIVHEAVYERPELLKSPRLIEEFVVLMQRYLQRPASRVATKKRTTKLASGKQS